ncbi:Hsp70 family protein [Phytohabitans houttuyneae]|uniref:Hsp70 family protein n=1 Tax=Phytohabitans houttuyneae TaxID=1076126 RepID=UPI001565FAF7|nr:Hsp70 family protein [Phytohabitans houttuyneae]
MGGDGYRVGVDLGTSNTAAVLAFPDGRVRPLLFDGSPLLPSAVFADPTATGSQAAGSEPMPGDAPAGSGPVAGLSGGPLAGLLVGRDATHAARTRPDCFEPHPKRCVDDGTVLLGDRSVPVPDLFRAVLRRVAAEAARVAGAPVARAVLTCPAGWGAARREVLLAAARAEFAGVELVTEPVAAATYFVAVAGGRVPVGSSVMVYDLGAGTFDASVVRRTAGGFEVLAAEGLPDVGGLDIDAAVFASLGRTYAGRDPAAWARLAEPVARADQRAARALWDDVRAGKEMLSRAPRTSVHVPVFDDDAPLGREEVEELARPILERTVALSGRVLAAAGFAASDLAGLFLVGGSSRMPLAARLLHRHLGVAPTVVEQPELAVAEGSLRASPTTAPPGEPAAEGPDWPGEPPVPPEPVEPRRLSPRVLAAAGLAIALLATVAAVLLYQRRDPRRTCCAASRRRCGPAATAARPPTCRARAPRHSAPGRRATRWWASSPARPAPTPPTTARYASPVRPPAKATAARAPAASTATRTPARPAAACSASSATVRPRCCGSTARPPSCHAPSRPHRTFPSCARRGGRGRDRRRSRPPRRPIWSGWWASPTAAGPASPTWTTSRAPPPVWRAGRAAPGRARCRTTASRASTPCAARWTPGSPRPALSRVSTVTRARRLNSSVPDASTCAAPRSGCCPATRVHRAPS